MSSDDSETKSVLNSRIKLKEYLQHHYQAFNEHVTLHGKGRYS